MYALHSGADFGVSGPIPHAPYSTWDYKGLHGVTSAPCNTDAHEARPMFAVHPAFVRQRWDGPEACLKLKRPPYPTVVGTAGYFFVQAGHRETAVEHAIEVIPFAAGAKLANMKVPVIAFGGDGATFPEGIGHLIHGVRSNYPITFVLHNNSNYGLTTGQASSLTLQGQSMNTSPNGIPEHALASMDLIFPLSPTFVARGFSGDIKLMTRILTAAIQHRGFAFVEMLQACPSYNHFATHEYLLDRYFDANAAGHDPGDLQQAKALVTQVQDRIACGILYQREDIPQFYDRLVPRQGIATTCVDMM